MSVVSTDSAQEIARRDALAQRLFTGLLETMELLTVQLGVKLGLYTCLHRDGPATAGELADRAGIHPRSPESGSNSRPQPGSSTPPAMTSIPTAAGSCCRPVTPRPCSTTTARPRSTPSHRH